MFISQLIEEYVQYYGTQDYVHGVLVEITGIAIELLFLSIAIPIILYFIRRIRARGIRSAVDFYLFQIFHRMTRMFLQMASINDIMPILMKEMIKNSRFKIYSHYIYGNLENILFVLNKILADGNAFKAEVEKKTLDDFQTYLKTTELCLEEIDRLAAMLVSLPNVQQELFKMRFLVYPLRDLIEKVIEDLRMSDNEPYRMKLHSYEVLRIAEQLNKIISTIFAKRRKLTDSIMKHNEWLSYALLFLSIPYLFVIRFWKRLKPRPREPNGITISGKETEHGKSNIHSKPLP